MGRIDEAIDILYEDEELALCCDEFLPAIEERLRALDRTLPLSIDSDFFVELVDKIRKELLKNGIPEGIMGVVTVTYELGSLGLDVARGIAEKLGYKLVFSEILQEVAKRLEVPEWEIEEFNEFKYVSSKLTIFDLFQIDRSFIDFGALFGEKRRDITFEEFREALTKAVTSFAVSNNVVIVGHASACILKEYPGTLHIKVEAPFADRVKVYAERTGVSLSEAERQLRRIDEKEKEFYRDLCDVDVADISLFHLKLNTSKLSVDSAVEVALKAFELVVGE